MVVLFVLNQKLHPLFYHRGSDNQFLEVVLRAHSDEQLRKCVLGQLVMQADNDFEEVISWRIIALHVLDEKELVFLDVAKDELAPSGLIDGG